MLPLVNITHLEVELDSGGAVEVKFNKEILKQQRSPAMYLATAIMASAFSQKRCGNASDSPKLMISQVPVGDNHTNMLLIFQRYNSAILSLQSTIN